jgi:flagellar basal body-associated protein FliL
MPKDIESQLDPIAQNTSSPDDPARSGHGLVALGALGFVGLVVLVECALAYLLLPTSGQAAAMAGAAIKSAGEREARQEEDQEQSQLDLAGQVEIDLGEFSVTAYQPASNTTLRIDFHLYGTVAAEDEAQFLTQMEDSLHRFREQVIVTVRSAEVTDLTDAGLGLLKRKILDRTNRILGKPLLRTVIFSDFSFIEQ